MTPTQFSRHVTRYKNDAWKDDLFLLAICVGWIVGGVVWWALGKELGW
jgi:hypothetical protein